MTKRSKNSPQTDQSSRRPSIAPDYDTTSQTHNTPVSNRDTPRSHDQNFSLSSTAHIGEYLQFHRERENLTIDDVSSKTKIKSHYLIAIEANDTATLPSLTHSIGFIKIYAALFNLDQNAIAAKFRSEIQPQIAPSSATIKKNHMPGILDTSESTGPSGLALLIIIMSLIVAVIAFMNFYLSSSQDKTSSSLKNNPIEKSAAPIALPLSMDDKGADKTIKNAASEGEANHIVQSEQNDRGETATLTTHPPADSNFLERNTLTQKKSQTLAQAATDLTLEETQITKTSDSLRTPVQHRDSPTDQNTPTAPKTIIPKTATSEEIETNQASTVQASQDPIDGLNTSEPSKLKKEKKLDGLTTPTISEPDSEIEIIRGPATSKGQKTQNPSIEAKLQLLKKPRIQYPSRCAAKAKDLEKVQLSFTVNNAGIPINPKIITSTNECFNRSALRSIKSARYSKPVNGSQSYKNITLMVSFTKA